MKKYLLILLATLLVSVPTIGQDTRTFAASPGGDLVLRLKSGGSVEVEGWERSEISVTWESTRDGVDFEFEPSSNGLTIRSTFQERGRNRSSRVDLYIQVPREFNIDLDSMGGGLTVRDVDGRFRGETMGGPIEMERVGGVAQITTMGGKITLRDSELDGSLKTMGGQVLFEDVIGDVTGSSMGGNVVYRNVQRKDGSLAGPKGRPLSDASGETVQISTMGGKIDIDEAPEGADVHTMGGDINIRNADRFVRAKTMGGDIDIMARGWVEATTMGGDVKVQVEEDPTGSTQDVHLVSMSGDVTLIVPDGFSMDIEVQLKYTRNSRQNYRIISDFDVQQEETEAWDYDHGTPRKTIYGTANVEGGRNRIVIETINGNVTIERR